MQQSVEFVTARWQRWHQPEKPGGAF